MTGPYVAVCGPAAATEEEEGWAEEVGRRLAEAGAVVVCGGLGGVMDAVARGAAGAGGTVIGILPGETRAGASAHLSVAIPTGLGEARNAVVARVADAVIAIGGEWGTLSEIALARKMGKPVIGLATWELETAGGTPGAIERATSPASATARAVELAGPA
ncbi:MAG: TIGR00725 family protein [Actinomycetota bacterium]